MENAIKFNGSPGQVAYEAWCYEFCDGVIDDPWFELNSHTQASWEDIAEAAQNNVVELPDNGFELIIRTNRMTLHYAWVGSMDSHMRTETLASVLAAMAGGQ